MTIANDPQIALGQQVIDDDLLRAEIEEWFELDDRMKPLRDKRKELKGRIDKAAKEAMQDGEGSVRVGPYLLTVWQQEEATRQVTDKAGLKVTVKRNKRTEHDG